MGAGDRFPLLLYHRVIRPRRRAATLLAILLLGLWYPVSRQMIPWPQPPADRLLLAGGLVSLAFALFATFSPRFAYVQPMDDHLRLSTPIARVAVSYRRIESTRPVDVAKAFPRSLLRGSDRRLLAPFAGKTALGIDLYALPVRPFLIRLFFHRLMLSPDKTGFIFIVPDWIELSRQLSSRLDAWRTSQQSHPRQPGATTVSDVLRELPSGFRGR
jgi:hypothetical protein